MSEPFLLSDLLVARGSYQPDGSWKSTYFMFRDLSADEVDEFCKSARDHWEPGLEIRYEVWHPVYCEELERLNHNGVLAPQTSPTTEGAHELN